MNQYFYVNEQGQVIGPVSMNALQMLYRQGRLTERSAVKPHEGLEWSTYEEMTRHLHPTRKTDWRKVKLLGILIASGVLMVAIEWHCSGLGKSRGPVEFPPAHEVPEVQPVTPAQVEPSKPLETPKKSSPKTSPTPLLSSQTPTDKPRDHELGEWYEFAYRQGQLTMRVHGWFEQKPEATHAALMQVLHALNASPASIGHQEMSLLLDGYADGLHAHPPKYQMSDSQAGSVLPRALQGFSRIKMESLANADSSDSQTLLEHAIKSTVMVQAKDGHGSGFFVAPGILITNKHVVDENTTVKVRVEETRVVKGRVISVSKDFDLAVVKVDILDHAHLDLTRQQQVKIGEDVVAIGYPQLADLSAVLNFGKISAKDRLFSNNPCYQIDVTLNKGNSGGPLVSTKTGRVVGINTFSLVSLGVVDRFNFSVIMDVAIRHLETHHPEVGLIVN